MLEIKFSISISWNVKPITTDSDIFYLFILYSIYYVLYNQYYIIKKQQHKKCKLKMSRKSLKLQIKTPTKP